MPAIAQKAASATRDILARNMRVLRAHADISQERLAFASGLHRTYIGAIERGEQNVSIDNIEKIAAALGIEVWRLLKADGAISLPPPEPPKKARRTA